MKHILVVDDEPAFLDVTHDILKAAGYQVSTALNAVIALDILRREFIDLVISDIKMPMMDGLTFLQESKKRWPHIGFIIVTCFWVENKEEIEKCSPLMLAFLKKPFDFKDLLALLKKYFAEEEKKTTGVSEKGHAA